MTKYKITLITEANSAAEAAARVSMDTDGEFLAEWESITVDKAHVPALASGGYARGGVTSPESIRRLTDVEKSNIRGGSL